MKESCCRMCKHLIELPFGEPFCNNEDSDYYQCECEPEEDLCAEFEEKE